MHTSDSLHGQQAEAWQIANSDIYIIVDMMTNMKVIK